MSAARIAAVTVALLCGTARVCARDTPTTASEPPAAQPITTLVLTVAGDDGEARSLGSVVQDLVAGVHVAVDVRRVDHVALWEVAEPPDAVHPEAARAWVDLADAARAVVYVKDGAHDRILVREVARTGVSAELTREELGHILQASVEGLVAGAEIGAPRAEMLPRLAPSKEPAPAAAPPAAPPPAPRSTPQPIARERPPAAPRTSPSRRWDVRAQYAAEVTAADRLSDGPGVGLDLALADPFGAALGAELRRPFDVEGDPVGVRLTRGMFRAALTWDHRLGATWSARLEAGGGVDAIRIAPQSSADPAVVKVAGDRTVWSGIARVGAGFDAQVLAQVGLWFGATLDLDPNGTRFVVARTKGDHAVFRPWPVRPALAIGVVL